MLPLTVLRRFDCVLESTKPRVVAAYEARRDGRIQGDALDRLLNKVAGQRFHNHSGLDFNKLKADPQNISHHLDDYINGFSRNVRDIFERFEFAAEIEKMNEANILYLIVAKFCDVDLHPDALDNIGMGLLFEDLIRRFNEAANETAGDHFTPREVIRLMVDILFAPDDAILTTPGKIYKLLDPACGTGGMLSEAQTHLRQMNVDEQLWVFGQDFNPRSYAIAASDLLLKGNPNSDIRFGDSLIDDKFPDDTFDYLLANPPFGVDWKRQQKVIQEEREKQGFAGRFGAGLPRVNDGALLFLQHMISKFIPYAPASRDETGSRLAIVFNGSPLFTGGAGSGESEIRKWVIENDWLDAIIALPEQMFFNTGINTYIWIVTNRKEPARRGKVQLIDGRECWKPMRRSLNQKRRFLGEDDISAIVREYGKFEETATSKIFANSDFGYNRVPIERPLRLLYTMDVERKGRFLDTFPHLLDDVQAIDRELGRTPRPDWTEFDRLLNDLLKRRGSRWRASEARAFRGVFAEVNAEAMPVVRKRRKACQDPDARIWGWFPCQQQSQEVMYEPNSDLRDFENVELVEVTNHTSSMSTTQPPGQDTLSSPNARQVVRYVRDEVLPHVQDAWADRTSVRAAYEINFNRYFYVYTPPRPLAEIDAEIKQLETEIVRLLREVAT